MTGFLSLPLNLTHMNTVRPYAFHKKHNLPRLVLPRNPDGSLPLDHDFDRALLVLNCASNIDGRELLNIKDLVKKVHKSGGIIIIDAAQAMAHTPHILHKTEADAICFSAHKLYAPSLGAIIARRDLLPKIDTTFIGGGMVDDATETGYTLSATDPGHAHTKFESGLQAWGEIIALGTAIDWLENLPKSAHQNLRQHTQQLYDFLSSHPQIHLVNQSPNPTMAFHIEGLDSHLVGSALADQHVMARTGYFCAHSYLDHKMHLPPLIRFSLGYHTRPEDVQKTIDILTKVC